MEAIEEKLLDRFHNKFGKRPSLKDELVYIGVDSIGMAEMTVELESEFGIHVDDDVFEVETVQELANYIRERQPKN